MPHNTASKHYPPGPAGILTLAGANGKAISPFQLLTTLWQEYGDVFRYKIPYGTFYLFNHPEDIKTVFQHLNIVRTPLLKIALGEGVLAGDNAHWRRQRQLMLPVFQRPNVAKFVQLFTDTTLAMLETWQGIAERGESLDVARAMDRLTLTVVSKALFSEDLDDRMGDFLNAFHTVIEHMGVIGLTVSFNAPLQISPTANARLQTALSTLNEIVYDLIAKRRSDQRRPDDLLTLLLSACDAETGQPLTDEQIRDEVVTMLEAGHETTSVALSWTWYLLSQHGDEAQHLQQNITQVLGSRTVTLGDLPQLGYARMVLDEAMRLYPPVWLLARQTETEDEIGGYTIPAHTGIMVLPYLVHRHPDFWPNPEQFDPERFNPETAPKRHPFAYFPFGGGRHLCLGKHFALLESQTILITVMQHYRIRPLADQPVELHPSISLRFRHGLMATLEPLFLTQ